MAVYRTDIADIELNNGQIFRSFMNNTIGSGDNLANRFGVRVFRNGEPENIGGTCFGLFVRADGVTVGISDGVVSGNEAYVTLPEACYAVEGNFTLAIKCQGGEATGTMRIVDGVVNRTSTETIVDPGTIIPSIEDLIDAIDTAVESIPADYSELLGSIASEYSTSRAYAVGDYAWVSGVLKRCIVAIPTAETYTADHWTNAVVGNDMAANLAREFFTLGQGITPTKISTMDGFDVFDDFDNVGTGLFRNNSYYRFAEFGQSDDPVAHTPVTPFNGHLLTYGENSTTSATYMQLAITNTGVIFTRNATSDWRRVIDLTQFDSFIENANLVSGLANAITPERIATEAYALYGDMNNFGLAGCPSNSIVRYANFTEMGAVDHSPVSVFNGILMSFSPISEYSEVFQIAADSYGMVATRYVRRGYEYTYPWRIVAKPVYDITNASDLFNLLQTITTGIIHLREFEYDLYTGLFEDLILADNTTRHFIDGDIEIIGAGTILKLHVPKAVAEAHTNAANATSIIDIMGNAKITGVIFDCKNTRYCCHYEASTNTAAFYKKITFEDCEFHYTRELSGLNADCVGIGGNLGQHFTFRNCKFANDIKGGIYIHTRQWCLGSLNVENCLFDCGWYGINLSQYTGTTAPIPVYIANSKTGLVLISTQSGGNANVQWKITYINSRYTQQIAEGSTLLYEPTTFNITDT